VAINHFRLLVALLAVGLLGGCSHAKASAKPATPMVPVESPSLSEIGCADDSVEALPVLSPVEESAAPEQKQTQPPER